GRRRRLRTCGEHLPREEELPDRGRRRLGERPLPADRLEVGGEQVKRALIVLAVLAVVLWAGGPAAAGDDPIGGQNTDDGTILSGGHQGQTGVPGVYHPGQPYVHSSGPPPPVYKDYY